MQRRINNLRKGKSTMTECTLLESYERCEGAGNIMEDIYATLQDAGMKPRVNSKQTEIVVDEKKKKVSSVLDKKGICTGIFDFLIYMKEQKEKTYIRLQYN